MNQTHCFQLRLKHNIRSTDSQLDANTNKLKTMVDATVMFLFGVFGSNDTLQQTIE